MNKGEDYPGIAVCCFAHNGQGKYLLHRRSPKSRDEYGTWAPPAGGVELGDTIEETIKKEIAEEFCTKVTKYEFLGYRDVLRVHEGKKTHWVILDFKVEIDPEKVQNGEPEKFEEIGWFPIESLPTPLHSEWERCLEAYDGKW